MQTILGGGGDIGKELAKDLQMYSLRVRIVSRSPKKINDTDELVAADLTNKEQTMKAVEGSEVVYLVAGLPYKLKLWQQQWPVIMKNVIDACVHYHSKLVFFDNIYMYDVSAISNLTEESRVNPPSKKGKVREAIAQRILDEVKAGGLTAMIVRSADFYGPQSAHSVVMETVYKNFKKGKKAGWLVNANKVHSFTYVPDAARATALLGNTEDAYNQVWHLPTSDERITGKQWIERLAQEMHLTSKFDVYPAAFIKLAGLFNPLLREMHEMLYQYDRDYFFNSAKFNQRFPNFQTTSYTEGIHQVVMEGLMDTERS